MSRNMNNLIFASYLIARVTKSVAFRDSYTSNPTEKMANQATPISMLKFP